jgi:hypothetical protein
VVDELHPDAIVDGVLHRNRGGSPKHSRGLGSLQSRWGLHRRRPRATGSIDLTSSRAVWGSSMRARSSQPPAGSGTIRPQVTTRSLLRTPSPWPPRIHVPLSHELGSERPGTAE